LRWDDWTIPYYFYVYTVHKVSGFCRSAFSPSIAANPVTQLKSIRKWHVKARRWEFPQFYLLFKRLSFAD